MNRNVVLDILKGIGILLVVFGHTLKNNVLVSIIYYFHMPLFFFLSGMALYYSLNKENKENISLKDFFIKKFRSILIPYLFFSIVSIIYWILIERKIRGQFDISIMQNFINIFIAKVDVNLYAYNIAMWFLPCLFMSELLFFIIFKIKNNYLKNLIIILSFLIGYFLSIKNIVLPFGFEITLIGIFFLYVGYNSIQKKLNIENTKIIKILQFILCIASIICLFLCYKFGNIVNMMNHLYSNMFLFLFGSFSGIYFCYFIAKFIEKSFNGKFKFFLKFLGENTIIIMCCHEPIKRMMIKLFSGETNLRTNVIFSFLITIFVNIVLIPIILIINKFFPFTIGKNYKKKKV